MTPKEHASLIEIVNWFLLLIGTPIFLLIVFAAFSSTGAIWRIFAAMGVAWGIYLGVWAIPAVCQVEGCDGRMEKTATQLSMFRSKLSYRCRKCGSVYEADVFTPPPSDPIP